MKKSLVLALLATCYLSAPVVANATTPEEETGATAQGRTAGGYASTGNFNTSLPAVSLPTPAAPAPVITAAAPAAPAAPATIEPASGGALNIFGAPVNARPGECYGKVTIPAVKKTETQQVLVESAGKTLARIVPAQYKTVTENFTAQEASEKLVTIPATYKTVTETVVVKPAGTKVIPIAAKYENQSEQVLVRPARTYWKEGAGPNQRVDATTGDIMCLVEEPAVYNTITKRVLVQPATTRTEATPAVTKQITKRVVDQPARVERQAIPAVTQQVTKRVLVTPEQPVYTDTAAKYRTVTKEVIVSPERVAWSEILCKTNANSNTVAAVQSALKKAGYNPGNVDGVLGSSTYSAVNSFQRDNNLHRGQITMETLKALGINS